MFTDNINLIAARSVETVVPMSKVKDRINQIRQVLSVKISGRIENKGEKR